MPINKNILVFGVGIAGPALAYWLHQYGFNVTIVEKTSAFRHGGYRVDVRGTAIKVIERMNLADEVRRKSVNLTSSWLINGSGRKLASIAPQMFGLRQKEDVEILRGDLAQILYEATKNYTEYIFNDSITSFSQTSDKSEMLGEVSVNFKNERSRTFDLVIGADGIYSNVRNLAFDGAESSFEDLGYYIAVYSIPNYLHLHNEELGYSNAGKIVNIFSTRQDNLAYALFIFSAESTPDDLSNIKRQKEVLRATFKTEGSAIRQVLEYLADSEDFYFSPLCQIQMTRLFRGRFVLVGDAGYCPSPASGQGTSLALVGGYVLAGELSQAKEDYQVAFSRYERKMRGFIEKNQQLAQIVLKEMIPDSKAKVWFQTNFLRLLPLLPNKEAIIKKMLGKMQQKVNDAANAIKLDEYHLT